MAASSFLRWGLILPIIVVALAVAFQFQKPLISSPTTEARPYCYQSVRTHNPEKPVAQCFSIHNGHVQQVWTDEEAIAEGLDVELLDGHAIPGLWDGHGHLLAYGEFLGSVDLFGSKSLDEVRDRIKLYLSKNPTAGTPTKWLRGVGWDQSAFGRMPAADDLESDPELKGLYVMLDRIDVHCSWVSQSVLNLLSSLPDEVPGGEIVRDPGMGVFCDNAMDIIYAKWPKPSAEVRAQLVKTAMKELNKVGLVGMHDAGAVPDTLNMYAELADSEDWTVRVYSMLECGRRNTFCSEEAIKIYRDDQMFTVQSVKLFADGALGSWGSAMLEPYSDQPDSTGSLLISASALTTVTEQWVSSGYQVCIHAIGDQANRNAIDAFEHSLRRHCPHATSSQDLLGCQERHRFRIEHAQIIHPDDQKRMFDLGIIPSIQPTHATSDMKYAEDRLGPERIRTEAYRMKSLLPISPVLGSDFPVEPPNPFEGIFAAVTRKSPATGYGPNGGSHGWHTQEALSVDDALSGFTTGVAYGSFMEDKAGFIKEGGFADWVVLDTPIERIDVDDLRNVKIRETWVGGRRVYKRA